jgi:DNA polymerase III epsilon subunit-like protein
LGYAQDNVQGREPSLELLARRLSLPVCAPHHALGDAMTTAAVFLALATKATAGGPKPASARFLVVRSADFGY